MDHIMQGSYHSDIEEQNKVSLPIGEAFLSAKQHETILEVINNKTKKSKIEEETHPAILPDNTNGSREHLTISDVNNEDKENLLNINADDILKVNENNRNDDDIVPTDKFPSVESNQPMKDPSNIVLNTTGQLKEFGTDLKSSAEAAAIELIDNIERKVLDIIHQIHNEREEYNFLHGNLDDESVDLERNLSVDEKVDKTISDVTSISQSDRVGVTEKRNQCSDDCRSLRSLHSLDRPPIPLQTYRWEDLRRAKQRGGYPWTHLYKGPLGANDDPIVAFRKRQELRSSRSPAITNTIEAEEIVENFEENISVPYIRSISELPDISKSENFQNKFPESDYVDLNNKSCSCISEFGLIIDKLKTCRPFDQHKRNNCPENSGPLHQTKGNRLESQKSLRRYSIMKKIRSMADQKKKRFNIKRITLRKDEKINLDEQPEILKLKNSPKSERGAIPHFIEKRDSDDTFEILELDESPSRKVRGEKLEESAGAGPEITETTDDGSSAVAVQDEASKVTIRIDECSDDPPRKTPRLYNSKHVYEEITTDETPIIANIFENAVVEELKESLNKQQFSTLESFSTDDNLKIDQMGSSEEDNVEKKSYLAPISSIDSTSSDEDRLKQDLPTVVEESDTASVSGNCMEKNTKDTVEEDTTPIASASQTYLDDETEPHREDIDLPKEIEETTRIEAANKWKNLSDHEYEPIESFPADDANAQPTASSQNDENTSKALETVDDQTVRDEDVEAADKSPQESESIRNRFVSSAQDRTRKMQAAIKNQANKIKTKFASPIKKPTSGGSSPKAQERKRFLSTEFSKLKMPAALHPDMQRFKNFKRPEFSKFNKPNIGKFKIGEKLSTIKLKRSKSLKENVPSSTVEDIDMSEQDPDQEDQDSHQKPHKKFDFHFDTYPRALRKKKKLEPSPSSFGNQNSSTIPSTGTQPSVESSSSPQGDRGFGPVRSRWADKFSDVSYNDSEGSRCRRYDSEQEVFDQESSLERGMRDDLEEATGSESHMNILGVVADNKQFTKYDEENRAIHEISYMRSREFKKRPIVHQDSDLRSEDSKEAVSWTERDIQKNKLLRTADIETGNDYQKFPSEDGNQETQSNSSSSKKVVLEEIDDDEFFLRKRGISEDNINLRQYISNVIRKGYYSPSNTSQNVDDKSDYLDNENRGSSPPPKPPRLHRNYRFDNFSQDIDPQGSSYSNDHLVPTNSFGPPKPPIRKGRSYSSDRFSADDDEYLQRARDKSTDSNHLQNMRELSPDLNVTEIAPPSYQPRRQKRKFKKSTEYEESKNEYRGRSVSNSHLYSPNDVFVYRTDNDIIVPLATPENYSGSKSNLSSDWRSVSQFNESEINFNVIEDKQFENDDKDEQTQEKYIVDMLENDGYAIVRKDTMTKPKPPLRQKKSSRMSAERGFAELGADQHDDENPSVSDKFIRSERESSAQKLVQAYDDDYIDSETERFGDIESPRYLQSGDVVEKMKYRPLPPPPRPPREKRKRFDSRNQNQNQNQNDNQTHFQGDDPLDKTNNIFHSISFIDKDTDSTSYNSKDNIHHLGETEVSTQTDPLPDDYEHEFFEITDDMKVIEPRKFPKSLDALLKKHDDDNDNDNDDTSKNKITEEKLTQSLQRFREANQRSLSEKSRASSLADRSRSLSRPQTPSSIVIERRISNQENESVVEASLTVLAIDDDLESSDHRSYPIESPEQSDSKDIELSYKDDEEANIEDIQGDYKENEFLKHSDEHQTAYELDSDVIQDSHDDEETERELESVRSPVSDAEVYESESLTDEKIEKPDQPEQSEQPEEPEEPVADPIVSIERQMTPELQPEIQPQTQPQTDPDPKPMLPSFIEELEVERLRVHALQADHITVTQLYGNKITSDEIESKSEKNFELSPEIVESIVERVSHANRTEVTNVETQTSLKASNESLHNAENTVQAVNIEKSTMQPTPTPTPTTGQCKNPDEETQTDTPVIALINPGVQPILAELCNVQQCNHSHHTHCQLHSHHHHHHHRRSSSSTSEEVDSIDHTENHETSHSRHRNPYTSHSHSRQMNGSTSNNSEPENVSQAARKFVSACSISLANITNELIQYVRGGAEKFQDASQRERQVSALIGAFVVVTLALLFYLLSGRNIHTHHWDFFNLPGSDGRQS